MSMSTISLSDNCSLTMILTEETAFSGVKKIAGKVAGDIELVTGKKPEVTENLKTLAERGCSVAILGATYGRSALADRLAAEGKLDLGGLTRNTQQKTGANDTAQSTDALLREVYTLQLVENPFPECPQLKQLLCVVGSDKRGTIYGLFRISELCGVTPMVYWGDAQPAHREEILLNLELPYVSKEPSVEYRGFFINDEWPAFGNWCMEHFGGVNAAMYEHIFEFILRLKGNYFWPAMWASVFSEDGPGIENARLADEMGIVMGTSHHEPLCRAGEEWKHVCANYGDNPAWSFLSNSDAITRFWEDGLLRNKDFENVITIGMRGEADSKLLPEDATMRDNVEVVKKAILAQNRLIAEHIDKDLAKVPRMLAIYKEVEDYYYGDETCEGLRTWEELRDVIFLLSDDNFGHLRSLPDENDRKHPGGFGMYYHFDYHGDPISFEWLTSTTLAKVWEQMTTAYEFGVRRMWIVNVGDLKGNEYPLSYFMNLAYDFDRWGSSNPDSPAEYAKQWMEEQFGGRVNASQMEDLSTVLEGYICLSSLRRPEALCPEVYHPVHFRESESILECVNALLKKAEELKETLPESCKDAFYSMIYYPACATLNNIRMNLDAGMNHELASRGLVAANFYGEKLKADIALDQELERQFHTWKGGKWNPMMSSAHTCFDSWNDYDWCYPTVQYVSPIPKAKAVVSFRGQDGCSMGRQWNGNPALANSDFLRPDCEQVIVDIDTRGSVAFTYQITCDKGWLFLSKREGRVMGADASAEIGYIPGRESIELRCDRSKLTGEDQAMVSILFRFENGAEDEARLCVRADAVPKSTDAQGSSGADTSDRVNGSGNYFAGMLHAIRAMGKKLFGKSAQEPQTPETDSEQKAQEAQESQETAGRGMSSCIFQQRQEAWISILAEHYSGQQDTTEGGFVRIPRLGRLCGGVKCMPADKDFRFVEEKPSVSYRFAAAKAGVYRLEVTLLCRNPHRKGGRMEFYCAANGGEMLTLSAAGEGFSTQGSCSEWAQGVLNQSRKVRTCVELQEGENTLTIYAGEPGIILERILLYSQEDKVPESYLGPRESWFGPLVK